jgi:hypothetical protein
MIDYLLRRRNIDNGYFPVLLHNTGQYRHFSAANLTPCLCFISSRYNRAYQKNANIP